MTKHERRLRPYRLRLDAIGSLGKSLILISDVHQYHWKKSQHGERYKIISFIIHYHQFGPALVIDLRSKYRR